MDSLVLHLHITQSTQRFLSDSARNPGINDNQASKGPVSAGMIRKSSLLLRYKEGNWLFTNLPFALCSLLVPAQGTL
jgi:hypothetical protein